MYSVNHDDPPTLIKLFITVVENYDVSLLLDTGTDTELLWAKVHFEKSKFLILGCLYRPPGSKIRKWKNSADIQIFFQKFRPNHHPLARL